MKKKIFFLTNFIIFLLHFSIIASAQSMVGYNDRIEQQELEIRRLVGAVESLKYENKNLTVQLKGLRKEIDLRFKAMEALKESNSVPDTSVLKNPKVKKLDIKEPIAGVTSENNAVEAIIEKKSQSTIKPVTAKQFYKQGQDFLKTKAYEKAQKSFNTFIKKFPNDQLAPNAYYWLGETYYVRKQYNKAALTFLDGKKKFPNSPKAGHNLLKLGLSLHYLDQKADACLTFKEIEQKYIVSDAALAKTLASSQKKAGCTAKS